MTETKWKVKTMSKVYIFTPTCRYGGVDVTLASVQRQTEKDCTWIVSDDLADKRPEMWEAISNRVDLIWGKSPDRREGDYRNLAASYNAAVELALEDPDAVLFITLQDYIWVAEDGVARFLQVNEKNPRSLLTGLCSITADPYPEEVLDRENPYSLFKEPYKDKPREIDWLDCRTQYCNDIRPGNHHEWEANWAAVPMILLREGLRWDREYDKGVAYENQDLAIQAITNFGSNILIDCENHALSLPHKKYFPEEEQRDGTMNNKEWHEKRWRERGFHDA